MNNILQADKENTMENADRLTVRGFGREWTAFPQDALTGDEKLRIFKSYFRIFPWNELPPDAIGFDCGCGSGRWASLVAKKVGLLHCVDPSREALDVARRNLAAEQNCAFHCASASAMPLPDNSMDFGYSLGVLHHVPDTAEALRQCVRKLKPGAPFLVYLYYRFDNKPFWFALVWKISDLLRRCIWLLPFGMKKIVTDMIALVCYWPLSRFAAVLALLKISVEHIPLSAYKDKSLYTLRTDALDRFGTKLEQRFTKKEITHMMSRAGLESIEFSALVPYWVAVGRKK